MVLTVFKCTSQVKGSEKTGSNYINEKNKVEYRQTESNFQYVQQVKV